QVLAVGRQRLAEAVNDMAPERRHQAVLYPVLVGQQGVALGMLDLEVVEPRAEHAEGGQLAGADDEGAARERLLLGLFLAIVRHRLSLARAGGRAPAPARPTAPTPPGRSPPR